jgi:hypothetical protein
MDSLYDLLADKNFDEPPEIAAIKDYVRQTFKSEVGVAMRGEDIIVTTASASLASRLRFDLPKLQKKLNIEKKIILRIGSTA